MPSDWDGTPLQHMLGGGSGLHSPSMHGMFRGMMPPPFELAGTLSGLLGDPMAGGRSLLASLAGGQVSGSAGASRQCRRNAGGHHGRYYEEGFDYEDGGMAAAAAAAAASSPMALQSLMMQVCDGCLWRVTNGESIRDCKRAACAAAGRFCHVSRAKM